MAVDQQWIFLAAAKVPLMYRLDLCRWPPIQSRTTAGACAVISCPILLQQCCLTCLVKGMHGHSIGAVFYHVKQQALHALTQSLNREDTGVIEMTAVSSGLRLWVNQIGSSSNLPTTTSPTPMH